MTAGEPGSTMIESDRKLLEIVRILREADGAGVTEVADRLDVAKSTVHKHLATLRHHGYVVNDDGQYHVGLKFLDRGIHARNRQVLYRASRARIDELAERTGESTWCMTHENGKSIKLYGATGQRAVHPPIRVGDRRYMHHSASGKVMLAHLPEDEIDAILDRYGMPAVTERTITDRDELLEELEAIRERGVAFNREESIPGMNHVAATITDLSGGVLGAIGISGPAQRLEGERLTADLPELLLGVANELEVNITQQGSDG